MNTERIERERRRRCGRRIEDLATHEDAYITLQALAEYLQVNEKTVMKWIEGGLLVAYRYPTARSDRRGMWRIRVADAIAFAERHRIKR